MTGAREKYARPMKARRGRFRLLRRRPSGAGAVATAGDEADESSTVCLRRRDVESGFENCQWHGHGDVPDASVDDLDDTEIAGDAAEDVGVVRGQAPRVYEPV